MDTNNNNNISIFNNDQFGELRVVSREGEPWFVAKDAAQALELGNMHSSLALLDDDEKDAIHSMDSAGRSQEMTIISEAGLYSLILRSRKPEAKAFKRWVTHEVLPSIRKHGVYATPSTIVELLRKPESMVEVLKELQAEQEVRYNAEIKIGVLAPAAAKYDKYLTVGENESVGTFAKSLRAVGIDVGVDQLFDVFRFKRVLCSGRGSHWNQPYSNYVRAGLMTTRPVPPEHKDHWKSTPLVTPRGRDYFIPRLESWIKEHAEFRKLGWSRPAWFSLRKGHMEGAED